LMGQWLSERLGQRDRWPLLPEDMRVLFLSFFPTSLRC
jgi:hypothetical protein